MQQELQRNTFNHKDANFDSVLEILIYSKYIRYFVGQTLNTVNWKLMQLILQFYKIKIFIVDKHSQSNVRIRVR